MFKTEPKLMYVLSAMIALLAAVASVGGIVVDDLYRDNQLVASTFYGNDLVTLLVAVPVLIGSLILSARNSLRAQSIWFGMLVYMAYNFTFYLFGAAFNRLFLVYVVLFAASIYTILILLSVLDIDAMAEHFQAGNITKWIGGYMLLVGVILGGIHTSLALDYVFTGQTPELLAMLDHPTSLISALDLSLIVPLHILGAIWLWQRRPWGFLLAIIVNVQGAVYNLVLVASVVSGVRAGVVDDPSEVLLWGTLAMVSLVISIFLLTRLNTQRSMAFILQRQDLETEVEMA